MASKALMVCCLVLVPILVFAQQISRSNLTNAERHLLQDSAAYVARAKPGTPGAGSSEVLRDLCARKCRFCFDGRNCDFDCVQRRCLYEQEPSNRQI